MAFVANDFLIIFAILLPSSVIMFIFGTLFAIHLKSLNMTYFLLSLIYTVISLILYLFATISIIIPAFETKWLTLFSYLILLPFIPTMCFVLSKVPLISSLGKNTHFYIYTATAIVILVLLITLDQLNHTHAHIHGLNMLTPRRAFVPSNSLIIIFGFASYIYCYLYILYIISKSSPILDKSISFLIKQAITSKRLTTLYNIIKIIAQTLLIISTVYIVIATMAHSVNIAIQTSKLMDGALMIINPQKQNISWSGTKLMNIH